ncbi:MULTISPECIES: energy transducer TonB [Sphingomonas]|nr:MULTISPECIES: energy transducer TonB [Sphingomonas]WCP71666.1 energy transducer TonB [Sphingomonas hankookensis]
MAPCRQGQCGAMRGNAMKAIMLAAILAGQGGAADVPPLKPASAWSVNYAEDMCVLSRDYGDAGNRVSVLFRPTPFNDRVQTVLVGDRKQLGYSPRVKVQIDGRAGKGVFDGDGQRTSLPKGRNMGITFDLPRDTVTDFAGTEPVGFALSGGKPFRVNLSLSRAALTALRKCETDLMQSWGFDVGAVDTAPVLPARAQRDPSMWLSNSDFPRQLLGANANVTVAWIITKEGGIRNCRVVRSSGNATFDAIPCEALARRARYTPARDANGHPVETLSSRVIRFKS